MKRFKENTGLMQKVWDWFNAYGIEGTRGTHIALFRHLLFLLIYGAGLFGLAWWLLSI